MFPIVNLSLSNDAICRNGESDTRRLVLIPMDIPIAFDNLCKFIVQVV